MNRFMLGAVSLALCSLVAGCGQGPANTAAKSSSSAVKPPIHAGTTQASHKVTPFRWPQVRVHKVGALPYPAQGTAVANRQGQIVAVGGYTGQASVNDVYRLIPTHGLIARLPVLTHDAAVGSIGSTIYVFGGGQNASYDTIVEVRGTKSTVIGKLPRPLSDAACVPLSYQGKSGLLVLGGYDGTVMNRSATFYYQHGSGLASSVLFHLPVGVRYPAVTVNHGAVYIAGGETDHGLSNRVYCWIPGQGIKPFTVLPYGVQKAALFAADRTLVLVGGRQVNGSDTSRILAIRTDNGRVHTLGSLPITMADMGYGQTNQMGYVVGGVADGSVSAAAYSLDFQ